MVRRQEWPDGRSLLAQPAITIEVFDIIKEQMLAELALARGR